MWGYRCTYASLSVPVCGISADWCGVMNAGEIAEKKGHKAEAEHSKRSRRTL